MLTLRSNHLYSSRYIFTHWLQTQTSIENALPAELGVEVIPWPDFLPKDQEHVWLVMYVPNMMVNYGFCILYLIGSLTFRISKCKQTLQHNIFKNVPQIMNTRVYTWLEWYVVDLLAKNHDMESLLYRALLAMRLLCLFEFG